MVLIKFGWWQSKAIEYRRYKTTNSLRRDIAISEVVILSDKYYNGDLFVRSFVCHGGFGAGANKTGQMIYGYFLDNGEQMCISGNEIDPALTKEHGYIKTDLGE